MALSTVDISNNRKVPAKEHLLASGRVVWSLLFIVLSAFVLIISAPLFWAGVIFIATAVGFVLLIMMACGGWLRH